MLNSDYPARILEEVRRQSEVKYVEHNRVSKWCIPDHVSCDVLYRKFTLHKLTVRLSKVLRTG